MCKIGGGINRCDAHWGPAQKAADLAKRRAKYAIKKGGKVRAYNQQDAQTVLDTVKGITEQGTNTFNVVSVNCENLAVCDKKGNYDESLLKQESDTIFDPNLNIRSTPLSGKRVDEGYYANSIVEGSVNWENLDEESYKAFGFASPEEECGIKDVSMSDLTTLSKKEINSLTDSEKMALSIFTSNAYKWINASLYNKTEGKSYHDASREDVTEEIVRDNLDYTEQTVEKFKGIVTNLDSAFTKASGQQRIVYRGVPPQHIGVNEDGTPFDLKQAMEHMKLGQEMVFDGYQSASCSPQVAADFGSLGQSEEWAGVMFEIKTSSGISVISNSHFIHEKEVVLPRNTRYMVVGVHQDVDYQAFDSTRPDTFKSRSYSHSYVVQLVEITETGEVASHTNRPAPPPALTDLQTVPREK